MQQVQLVNVKASLKGLGNDVYYLDDLNINVSSLQQWVLLGANGAGKSAVAAAIAGFAKIEKGQYENSFERIALVSPDSQKQLLAAELTKDQDDIIDGVTPSSTVYELIIAGRDEQQLDSDLLQQLISLFDFSDKLSKAFRDLSTGETRKLMLIQAIIGRPDLLVLDEPFDGLDVMAMAGLNQLLAELSKTTTLIFVLNRLTEIPDFVDHYAYVKEGHVTEQLAKPSPEQRDDLLKLLHLTHTQLQIPDADIDHQAPPLTDSMLVRLNNAAVSYGGEAIFEKLNWQINQGEHWQLTGKNGSGKTCLLNLITGDNPQCYNNDIKVFGYQRGSGESIWQIKQHIGYISNALHMDYRVSITALNTVVSGFYDSIGLYQKATDKQLAIAKNWLALLGLSDKQSSSFSQLSFGDQRLLLIARAMVKHPNLLILDEPCLGLDEANRQRVLLLIEKICAAGTSTVVYVNHHASDKIAGINNYLEMADFTKKAP
ncbi:MULTISPECIES: molybdate ABC transporter ATP-binding protein ModF [Pseudoalteromonas]|uniref:molybdate ABC transporter ATP-binding protein ModF n=1 Tax=Pseudoalteromonas TaxID=53246 RepID=UPI001582D831|nr:MULTISPECIES: molybdate ABC transporter ATP-binding protein ModF [Pseudoalteromonas]MDI4654609.1 molybdate ABC transporter ATP-binding protein ModF [Pseudoalteromonas shioyasakiensis]NUJ41003.1 molybdate ABC transporter ATP-binding protein ModF [Pseudoalteromonas sp. 0303]